MHVRRAGAYAELMFWLIRLCFLCFWLSKSNLWSTCETSLFKKEKKNRDSKNVINIHSEDNNGQGPLGKKRQSCFHSNFGILLKWYYRGQAALSSQGISLSTLLHGCWLCCFTRSFCFHILFIFHRPKLSHITRLNCKAGWECNLCQPQIKEKRTILVTASGTFIGLTETQLFLNESFHST